MYLVRATGFICISRFCNRFRIPVVVILMSGIMGCGEEPLSGMGPLCSLEKTA